jgi:hypothetical protein
MHARLMAAVFACALLEGCSAQPMETVSAQWAARGLFFVAVTANGDVRVLTRVGERLVPTATLRAPDRDAALAPLIDERQEAIWVLGRRNIDLHDLARPGGGLRLRQPLPAGSRPEALFPDDSGGLRVVDAGGATVAALDATLPCWH